MDKMNGYDVNNPRVENGVTKWDLIEFGNYCQGEESQLEPIRWRVLSVNGDDVFLLADKNLDCVPYNEKRTAVTWETCTLRKWLNNDFYNMAFDTEEKKAVMETTVVNKDNPEYGTEGGNDTKDRVYLLSKDEACNAEYGFDKEFTKGSGTRISTGNGYWWLRSPGSHSNSALCVGCDGYGHDRGSSVNFSKFAVRPALHINLSSSVWRKVDEISAYDDVGNSADVDVKKDVVVSNPRVENGITTWDLIEFGNYGQGENFDPEPIRWRVLSVNGDDAFLLADRNLDHMPYNGDRKNATWETCTLRNWLNNGFYNKAFDTMEKQAIMETMVVNKDKLQYGGNDTKDRVYLLSIDEVCNAAYGFDVEFNKDSRTRKSKDTDYVKKRHRASISDSRAKAGYWWLRSPGLNSYYAANVKDDGYGRYDGHTVYNGLYGVRPALHINLSSSSWRKVGEINSKGDVSTFVDMSIPVQKKGSIKPANLDIKRGEVVSNPRVENGITTWNLIEFGNYYQNDKSRMEPIRWRVLSVNGDDAFLLADKILDCMSYDNTKIKYLTWQTCTLRYWLNNDFYNMAFDIEEKKAIIETTVGKVYLLSKDEACNVAYGFGFKRKNPRTRESKNTDYAKNKGAYSSTGFGTAENGYWWLRSLGTNSNKAVTVDNNGNIRDDGNYVSNGKFGVRPALHINISSSSWRKVGVIRV